MPAAYWCFTSVSQKPGKSMLPKLFQIVFSHSLQDFRKHATTVGTGTVTVPAFQIRHLAGKIDRLEGKHP
jgi:hypothetical protein